jgi:hypothetical protein
MRSLKVMGVLAVAACVAMAGTAGAQVKGAGKSSITIVKTPAPSDTTPTPKTAGSVSSKAQATVAGKPPTGGGSFALKLAKDVGDPTKPGFADGEYVLEIESAGTPTGDMIGSPVAAAFFIEFSVAAGKCTIRNNPQFTDGVGPCGGMAQPPCAAPEGVGKCSAQIYQVAGDLLSAAGLVANQPFGGRFRVRSNPTPASCETGHLMLQATAPTPTPPSSTCRTGAVVGVGGVALGTTD